MYNVTLTGTVKNKSELLALIASLSTLIATSCPEELGRFTHLEMQDTSKDQPYTVVVSKHSGYAPFPQPFPRMGPAPMIGRPIF